MEQENRDGAGLTIVTGGSGGIGQEIARGLAARGHHLILPIRNEAKGRRARQAIVADSPQATVELGSLDLADLSSVDRFVSEMLKQDQPISLLVLNAGIICLSETRPRHSADGYELNFQTNYLAQAALTRGLMPLLRVGHARIVAQCSLAAAWGRLDWDTLIGSRRYFPFRAYHQSKIALGLFGMEIDRRSRERGWGISAQLSHPGIVPGSQIAPALRGKVPAPLVHWAVENLGNSPASAAQTAIAAAASTQLRPMLYAPSEWGGCAGEPEPREPFTPLRDAPAGRELWDKTVRFLG